MASLSAPITALRQRFSGRKRGGLGSELDPSDPQVQLQQLGERLRERRESLDLTMRQLALDTRVSIGPVQLGDLPSGHWRRLHPDEQAALNAVTLAASRQESSQH